MLSVLAEFQRELIVANTRDGLAGPAARRRPTPGTPPSPGPRPPNGSTTNSSTPCSRSPTSSA
nr:MULTISPECIES: hypothetical protein [Nocardia]